MIREFEDKDRAAVDRMQFELQKYFAEIDSTGETLAYRTKDAAHQYMGKMLRDVEEMQGKLYVAEKDGEIVGFTQGVIIEHRKGEDEIYDLSHRPGKEGWVGLLFVEPKFRGQGIGQGLLDAMKRYFRKRECTSMRLLVLSDNVGAIAMYRKNGFRGHDLEMVRDLRQD